MWLYILNTKLKEVEIKFTELVVRFTTTKIRRSLAKKSVNESSYTIPVIKYFINYLDIIDTFSNYKKILFVLHILLLLFFKCQNSNNNFANYKQ